MSGNDWDAYHFAGMDQDSSSNDHAQFRGYSNMAGRWMSPDPYDGSYDSANPQSFNRYAYVLNSPLSLYDPLGLECVKVVDEWARSSDDGGATWSPWEPVTSHVQCTSGAFQTSSGSGGAVGGAIPGIGGGGAPSKPTNGADWKFTVNSILSSVVGPLPSCHALDNVGDVLEWGSAGILASAGVATIIPGGQAYAGGAGAVGGVVGFVGVTADKAAKHGIGCW